MITWPLVRYVLMAALRDRLVLCLLLMIGVGASLSLFLGSAAILEYDRFSLVFAAGGLRMAGVIGLVLFTVFHIRRSFDNKDVEFLLSRPIGRTSFILSHALAFSLLAIAVGLTIGAALCIVAPHNIGPGHALWTFSLVVELIIAVNAALFFSMVVASAAGGVLSVFGLYVLARLIGQLLGIAGIDAPGRTATIIRPLMNVISMVVPRLDLLSQTTWLIYPRTDGSVGYGFVAMEGIFYTGLLICAALLDLRRRQF